MIEEAALTNMGVWRLRRGVAIAALAVALAAAGVLLACGSDPTPTDLVPDNPLAPNDSQAIGDPGAPVTMVEFSDFQ